MVDRYSTQIQIEAGKYYQLSDTEWVMIDYELLGIDRNVALSEKRLLILSKRSQRDFQELKGFVYYHPELKKFICERLPVTLGHWHINKSTLDKNAAQRLLAKASQHAPFLQIDILQVERSRYVLKKKIGQKTLADILDNDDMCASLTIAERCEISLSLTQAMLKIHAKQDILCRLTPDNIQVNLSAKNIKVIISDFSLCQRTKTQKVFYSDDIFTPPECRNKPDGVTIFSPMDVYVLGRIFWLVWGNKTFLTDECFSLDAFIGLKGVNERYKNKLHELLVNMCSPCISVRPMLDIKDTSKPKGVLFLLKCMTAHYSFFQPTKNDYERTLSKPLRYIQQFSPINANEFKHLIDKTFQTLESLLGVKNLSHTRRGFMPVIDIHQLVDMCMLNHTKTTFSANDFLCQFMKVAQDNQLLDYFCCELSIENINPSLLVLDSNAKLSYIQWRSAIFFDFDRAKVERQKFYNAIESYMASKIIDHDESEKFRV